VADALGRGRRAVPAVARETMREVKDAMGLG
jgi:hypothetical protein